ncbi:hypothetical protein [Chryseolinea sp. H1M3-3]|uniref:hypothetical protein n=1 Tax=Chryseolinea sp. H1M3-3 TaxID=3034144 RepID=UPI0023ED4055|nr:hypothetical protein [Chryseolinea sp. H1M3-3]
MQEEVSKLNFYSNVLMLITSLHHVYGAMVYETPWRLHVLLLSIPVVILTTTIHWLVKNRAGKWKNHLSVINGLIILVFSIILIGAYEGVYNHAIKNIVFFSGIDDGILAKMFPSPKYVLPNNLLFESTGVMQAILFVPLVRNFITFSKVIIKKVRDGGYNL